MKNYLQEFGEARVLASGGAAPGGMPSMPPGGAMPPPDPAAGGGSGAPGQMGMAGDATQGADQGMGQAGAGDAMAQVDQMVGQWVETQDPGLANATMQLLAQAFGYADAGGGAAATDPNAQAAGAAMGGAAGMSGGSTDPSTAAGSPPQPGTYKRGGKTPKAKDMPAKKRAMPDIPMPPAKKSAGYQRAR